MEIGEEPLYVLSRPGFQLAMGAVPNTVEYGSVMATTSIEQGQPGQGDAPTLAREITEAAIVAEVGSVTVAYNNGMYPAPPLSLKRGKCPSCGADVVANLYWNTERGYLLRYECWAALIEKYEGDCRWFGVP